MTQYETEAILLVVKNWGEADKMVTFFSREHGKVTAIAYGARRPKSRLAGGMQAFMHIDVALMPGKNLDSIKQYECKNSFRLIREDLTCMAYGLFIAELVAELCPERQPEPLVFDLLLDIFTLISARNPRLVALAGAWQLLSMTGFLPEYKKCICCDQPLTTQAYFLASAGGLACCNCKMQDSIEISMSAVDFLDILLSLDLQNPGHFKVTGMALLETEKMLAKYLMYHLDKPLRSLAFIKQITFK